VRGLTTLIISLLAPIPAVAGTVPKFSDYAVDEVFSGERATVDLDSAPGARMFRTLLREAAAKSPNFAGYFVVASWGAARAARISRLSTFAAVVSPSAPLPPLSGRTSA